MSRARSNPHPASRARATIWTPARVRAVCKRHARGVFLKHACALEGGSHEGLRDAAARDPQIATAVAQAHARGVEHLRKMLDTADDWKRAAWELERFDREAYAPPKQQVESKNEHSGPGGAPLVLDTRTRAERLLALRRAIDEEQEETKNE